MSHIVTIQTKVHDPAAVASACARQGLDAPIVGAARLYSGASVNGLIVRLPGWTYPAVVDLATGEVKYDNYGGEWGEQAHLDKFLQLYAVERAKLEARKKGCSVNEQLLQDGSIKLQITERT
jgi:hypothetical protein